MYQSFLKPVFDRTGSLIVLLAASPVLLIAMTALFVANGGKVWFIQPRPGLKGKLFNILKFRTMTDQRDEMGNLLSDKQRLTFVGRLIRSFSVDELPQLVNVLRGDMSIVGPRPLLEEYLPLYNPQQRKRHEIKPGITGWAQVNGRNTVSWQQKFEFDCWYVDHVSLWLDVKILFLTVVKVLKLEGITSSTSATMEKFRGND